MTRGIELEDVLGEAASFARGIILAAGGLGDSQDTYALQALAEQISNRLEKARCIIDELREGRS